jgi:hypothetical protein
MCEKARLLALTEQSSYWEGVDEDNVSLDQAVDS